MKQYNENRPSLPADIRRSVEVEAGHKCSIKECNEHTYLEIHHINENREDNQLENLILLCTKHHKMAHKKVIDRKALKKYKSLLETEKSFQKKYNSTFQPEENEYYGFLDYLEIINKRTEEIKSILTHYRERQKTYNNLIDNTVDKVLTINASMHKISKEQSAKEMKKIFQLFSNDTNKYSEFLNSQLKILSESRQDLFHSIPKAVEFSTSDHKISPKTALNVFKAPLLEFKSSLKDLISSSNIFLNKMKDALDMNMSKDSSKSYLKSINALEEFIYELEQFILSIDNL
jgi:hypothetical protein